MKAARLTGVPLLILLLALGLLVSPTCAFAALEASDTTWDGSEPPQGVYFHWYEPSFYMGFAPRTEDPQRVHIRVSRGNQVRVTVVLGDKELDAYLDDLVLRRKTYQELIDAKVIELTTNKEYERKNRDHTPIRSYVTNRRAPFYHWLYGDNINMADVGHASLKQVPVCRYIGKKADEAQTLTDVPLYEAKYAPELIQFYRTKPVAFDSDAGFELNRELRKVGVGHTTDRGKLLLK